MAERPDCARMDQLIPELAIGVAAGDERAHLLGHLARCVPCRGVLESATSAADSLLLVAPEREPPPGFETRVLTGLAGQAPRDARPWEPLSGLPSALPPAPPSERMPRWTRRESQRRPRHRLEPSPRPASSFHAEAAPPAQPSPYAGSPYAGSPYAGSPLYPTPPGVRPSSRAGPRTARWRRTLLRLATAVTIAGLVGGALWWRTDDDRHLAAGYRATLAIAHGRYMSAAPLLTQVAAPAGYMVAYEGEPSWILVIVRTGDVSGDYAVRLITRAGLPIPLGTMSVAHGQGSWGVTISIPVDQIGAVTLTHPRALPMTAHLD